MNHHYEALYNSLMEKMPQILAELAEGKGYGGVVEVDDIATVDGSPCVIMVRLLPPGVRFSNIEFEIDFEARHLNDNSIDYFVFFDPSKPHSISLKAGGAVRSLVPEAVRLLGTESKQTHSIPLHFKPEELAA